MLPYEARVIEKIENRPGTWNSIRVGVFDDAGAQLGEYIRNYPSLYKTFCPFTVDDGARWLALYSKDYTASRLMELPSCQDIGGEESASNGFCPVEFCVPGYQWVGPFPDISDSKREKIFELDGEEDGDSRPDGHAPFGFVAGCGWGDDSSWKIEFLDLSKAPEGTIKRDSRFGYIELPRALSLAGAIEIWREDAVTIAVKRHYRITGEEQKW